MKARTILLMVVLLGLVIPGLGAQTIIPANAITVTWDPVTTLDNGDPVPPADSIGYEMVYAPAGSGYDPVTEDGTVTGPPHTFNLPAEGLWALGVRTVRIVEATSERRVSAINWSDVDIPTGSTPDPFLVSVYRAPSGAAGLRVIVP